MNIPSLIQTKPLDENGNWVPEWSNLFSQLLSQMQTNLSGEGYILPRLPTTDIDYLGSTSETVEKSIGAMIYDSTTNEFKVNLNGTWRVVMVA